MLSIETKSPHRFRSVSSLAAFGLSLRAVFYKEHAYARVFRA